MNADEFAKNCRAEKDSMVRDYFDAQPEDEPAVGSLIKSLELSDDQTIVLREILDGALTEAFYLLLLAIDGSASLNGDQQMYELRDEDGNIVSAGDGDLEAAAFDYFQESDD
jgi:hypothetical protein